ncbi:MAG: hypothetical protein IT428_07875 [Planctomycetaceae bacterium]|nr:hypothetical protein [Planctomycetaceae bacterium]
MARPPRLLSLVAASTLLIVSVTILVNTTRQHAAITEITRLGGNVQTTQGGPDWLRRLVGHRLMSVLDRATVVKLSGTETTDADLELVGHLRGVERLAVARTKVTDVGMTGIGRLTGLKALDLGETVITDIGVAHLAQLRNLEFLYLEGTAVTDTGLAHLKHLPNLRTLAVEGTAVSEAGVEKLRKALPGLKEIGR